MWSSCCQLPREIFFSIVQRKALTPAAAAHPDALTTTRILGFEADCRTEPRPIRWSFTRADFDRRLRELAA
jgi:hypothetical protein